MAKEKPHITHEKEMEQQTWVVLELNDKTPQFRGDDAATNKAVEMASASPGKMFVVAQALRRVSQPTGVLMREFDFPREG